MLRSQCDWRIEPDSAFPLVQRIEPDSAQIPTGKPLHLGGFLGQQDRAVYAWEVRDDLAEGRSDLARLIGYAVSFLGQNVRVRVYPLRGPVFDLDDPNAWRANCDDVDFIGLELMGNGEGEIRQEDPFVAAWCRLQAAFQVLEGTQLALIGCRPTGKQGYPHSLASL